MENDPWDKISSHFVDHEELAASISKENIEFLWPQIFQFFGDVQGKSILDFGCGTGALCRRFAKDGANVTGIDTSNDMLQLAMREPNENIEYFKSLDSVNNKFDAAVSIHVFEFIEGAQERLRSFGDRIKQNSPACFVIYDLEFFEHESCKDRISIVDEQVYYKICGTNVPMFLPEEGEFRRMLKNSGFAVNKVQRPLYSDNFKKKHGIDPDIKNWAIMFMCSKK